MFLSTLLLAALAEALPQFPGSGNGPTMLRFGCSQLVIDRIDPLVTPGQLPSPHMHQVVGGDVFNVSMPEDDIGALASCTTCSYAEDRSNYWTANMYFRARNGSYKRVPQIPNRCVPATSSPPWVPTSISCVYIVIYQHHLYNLV